MKPDPNDELRSDPAAPAHRDPSQDLNDDPTEHARDHPDGEYRPRPHEHLVEPMFAGLETPRPAGSGGAVADGSRPVAHDLEAAEGAATERPGLLRRMWRALRGK